MVYLTSVFQKGWIIVFILYCPSAVLQDLFKNTDLRVHTSEIPVRVTIQFGGLLKMLKVLLHATKHELLFRDLWLFRLDDSTVGRVFAWLDPI